jgi:predicted nucleic acid-binding protein
VRDVVLDASVVLKWFRQEGERHAEAARALRAAFAAGELLVLAPSLLLLEIVNVAGRRWGWDEAAVTELAAALDALGFELVEPELLRVAGWTGRGLTAYDAAYVAVAEAAGIELVTDDEHVLNVASGVAIPLAGQKQTGT